MSPWKTLAGVSCCPRSPDLPGRAGGWQEMHLKHRTAEVQSWRPFSTRLGGKGPGVTGQRLAGSSCHCCALPVWPHARPCPHPESRQPCGAVGPVKHQGCREAGLQTRERMGSLMEPLRPWLGKQLALSDEKGKGFTVPHSEDRSQALPASGSLSCPGRHTLMHW